ncbi:S9 family peptidase [Chitinophaga ginsengisoli]|uniref:Dipeptidyl aminopeptidase/acylaminoacyl peptidase n=1 Tax=Chitinophaga ginsengisoli TaxID=363837 RepID=A0A2P8GE80_9BACT|nr:S9 family peptidase [Chitinophaga ginsengisoli]PSL32256.1 dipeptidyl aminopeptidase/acylaminoacyl peptidase [Chitinophaga ginsengisoli]
MNKLLLTISCAITICRLNAQQPVPVNDYRFAESRLIYNTEPLVDNNAVSPEWLEDGRCWYRVLTARGSEFILVNPAKGTRTAAFDQEKMAAALSKATGATYTAYALPFRSFRFLNGNKSIAFAAAGSWWTCDLPSYEIKKTGEQSSAFSDSRSEVISPDGRLAAFIKDDNLWVRELPNGPERALTTDGTKDFGYATDNAGWRHSDKPILRWSHDSRKIATFKQDQRQVSDMYLVTTNIGKPALKTWKYPLAGDPVIPMIHRVIIEVNPAKVIPLQVAADPHRGTLSDDISSSGTFDDVDWSDDNTELAFVSTSRNHKQEKVRIANAATGAVREVFGENVATQYESGQDAINWHYLKKTNEIIWYSERDNWGHLYLYDATTGALKHQITKGQWLVTSVERVDEQKRVIYFKACGLDAHNPYFSHFCSINFDGSGFSDLTPETGNHKLTFSPDGQYFIDSYSQPDVPATTVLRNSQGKLLVSLEKANITRLKATGWKAPMPFSVKAHDGKTDIYGLLFTPTHLDSNKKYPIIDYIYPGPQGGGVRDWSFLAARLDHQALAELGFVVMVLEGTSNPLRSKSYHDMNYGNMAENTLPDQVTGIRQLAARYAYIDTSRIGIWGHSGGGFATAAAMFRYPDFFKVGISESGNHENRNYEDDWGERYNGLTSESDYAKQANALYAANLKGKLLLAHGMMDDNVPPYNTLLVVDALTKANKDYDLIIFPQARHGFAADAPYMMRRRWDYFVRNLLQKDPPKEYQLLSKPDPRN